MYHVLNVKNGYKKYLILNTLYFILILSFIPITVKLISIHPNENVYFNPLIGGLSGAKEKNIIYWGNTFGNVYKQGVEWINKNAEKDSIVVRGIAYEDTIPSTWFRRDIKYAGIYKSGFEKKGEYIIELTHDMPVWSYYYYFNYAKNTLKPVYEVKVDDVAVLSVWKNDLLHTKEEFRHKEDKKITVNNYKKENNSILIDIGEEILLKEVDIFFADPSCSFTDEGYFVTADKNQKWTNHPGDLGEIAFYKNFNPRSNKGALSYLFPLLKTKIVKVIYSQKNTCLENIKEIEISGI